MTVSIKGNEVFTILGHNGAGKTTAIYMLTGMLEPTSGEATLYNDSVVTDLDDVRRNLGLCQQFDVLYNELTAYEHL
jgi:ABC-type multidrug transport system ATPase subunit